MKIKIIPETKEEKENFEAKGLNSIEHKGVKEYFFFGNKQSVTRSEEFLEWNGSYRYLIGSLAYFFELIKINIGNSYTYAEENYYNVEKLDEANEDPKGFVKRGTVEDSKIIPLDVSKIENNDKKDNE